MNANTKNKIKRELLMKRCAYCRKKPPEVKLTIDHKIPLSRGGANNLDNLQSLCQRCNGIKSAVTHEEIKRIVRWWLDIKGFQHKKGKPIK